MEKRQLNTGDRITTASLREEDAVSEPKLRPITLDTYRSGKSKRKYAYLYAGSKTKRGMS